MTHKIKPIWPRSKTGVRLIERGARDDQGRCQFTLLWWDGDRQRAQVFFAKPHETRRRLLSTIRGRS